MLYHFHKDARNYIDPSLYDIDIDGIPDYEEIMFEYTNKDGVTIPTTESSIAAQHIAERL